MRNSMKKLLLSAAGIFAAFSALTLTSCEEDKCKTVRCAYNGQCNDDGSCTCVTGYEGERCETISRDKFKGVWTVVEDGTTSNPAQYAVTVRDGGEIDQVWIKNFYNSYNEEVVGKVLNDTLIIPAQKLQTNDTTPGRQYKTVEGKGWAVPEGYYGLHGKMLLQYKVTAEDGTVNEFGWRGAGTASEWTK
jgi:hypothetical protein